MEMRQSLHITQEITQRQILVMPSFSDKEPFWTDEEYLQVSQYEILKTLAEKINNDEYIDSDHFELEINRTIFRNPLESKVGNFGRSLQFLLNNYNANEKTATQIFQALGYDEEENKKDMPETIANKWLSIT
ncbi:hypothetical protein ACFL1H_03675, partial [Nanoarchaeota archaeon]